MSFGNENGALSARLSGVKTASDGTATTGGKPQTLVGLVEAKCYFAQYNDERGAAQMIMFFDVGGQLVADPGSSAWCLRLRPLSDWLRKQVSAQVASATPVEVPKEDQVDVMDDG